MQIKLRAAKGHHREAGEGVPGSLGNAGRLPREGNGEARYEG